MSTIDSTAALERLFARATAGPDRSLQDWLRLTLDGLGHIYAKADAIGDLSAAARVLREMRALLQFHALVEPAKLRTHAGWHEPQPPRDSIYYMEQLVHAQMDGDPRKVAIAQAELDAVWATKVTTWDDYQTPSAER